MGYKYFIGLKKRGMHSRWLHSLFYGRFRAGWKWSNALRYICRLLDGTIFLPSAHFMSLERREIWAIRRTFWINLASFLQRPIQSYSFLCFVLVWCCKAKIVAGRIVKAVRPAFLKRRANRKKSNLSFFRFYFFSRVQFLHGDKVDYTFVPLFFLFSAWHQHISAGEERGWTHQCFVTKKSERRFSRFSFELFSSFLWLFKVDDSTQMLSCALASNGKLNLKTSYFQMICDGDSWLHISWIVG